MIVHPTFISMGIIYIVTGFYKISVDPIFGVLAILLGLFYIKHSFEIGESVK
jgi:hypothetical protein